ncbi:unnamed protein product [Peniophora sp. CBMAI 1063]|nr:unnamed protein product [Peniophora sp. CBMAI 1063]
MAKDDAQRLAEEWLMMLTRTVPLSSWLSPIRALLESFPRTFVEAGGSFDELSKVDLRELSSFVPQLGILLRQYQNAITPISRLPPEIMEAVFIALRDLSLPAWDDQRSKPTHWVRACTHVCNKWRTVALHLPDLWTCLDISYASPETLMMMVRRTQGHRCDLVMSRPSVGFEVAHMLLHGARVLGPVFGGISFMELQIGARSHVVPFLSSASLPKLAELKISAPEEKAPAHDFPRPSRITIILPACSFPALRSLVLKNCTIFSRAEMTDAHHEALFPLLDTLVIDCGDIIPVFWAVQPRPFQGGADRPSIFELLAITPRLRSLTLIQPFPALFCVPPESVTRIPTSLRQVSLAMKQDRRKMKYTTFVRSLHLGDIPGVEVDLRILRPPKAFRRQLCYKRKDAELRRFYELLGVERPPIELVVSFTPATASLTNPHGRRSTHIHIVAKDCEGFTPSTHFTLEDHSGNDMFTGLPLDQLEKLTLDVTHDAHLQVSGEWWKKHFTRAKNVRQVEVIGGFESAFALVRALFANTGADHTESANSVKQVPTINLGYPVNEGLTNEDGVEDPTPNIAVTEEPLFPHLTRLCIRDKSCEADRAPTLGWRRVRALENMSTSRSSAPGVEALSKLSLPSRFADKSWAKHLRSRFDELLFE